LGGVLGGDRKPLALSLIIMILEGEDSMDWSTSAKKDLNEPATILMD
jgi:hypothetical protein